ncbi:phosphotransferase family protein [Rhodococcus sp. X156]|uniref:phosphotransferase family protein n=1 Tax=Rhodococcus sp. X156 TaxID=2499145 RepID=UPI001F4A09BB|nr:phosphotransferase family protein [Rhodococcus sp. X156]
MTLEKHRITTTARSFASLQEPLRAWLADRVGDATAELTVADQDDVMGFSSASVLFDASWTVDGRRHSGSFVARTAPESTAMLVFPRYDMAQQFEILRRVAALSDVPVPGLWWLETDPAVLGASFFVMERAYGQVPPDNLPYVFDSWVLDATPEQRQRLQDSTLQVLADIHAIGEPETVFDDLCPGDPAQALRRHVDDQHAYYRWALLDDGIRVPIIDRAFAWLEQHWPAEPGPNVLLWGDARIGNVMYQDFEPVAVFDWEMAAVGPREIDVAWFIFLHRFFQDFADMAGVPGLPDFLRRSDVVRSYEQASGATVADLDFYLVYAALRHAIVMARIKRRSMHFGEDTLPEDPDDFVMHRVAMEKLLAGTYGWS